MKIKFCGAAREVTGSCHLVTLDSGFTLLLDCGLYQGNSPQLANFNNEWLFNPADIDCMILSHAHIDHTGKIPKLVKDGYKNIINCTHATRGLCAIMLLDSAGIQERDAEFEKFEKLLPNFKYDIALSREKDWQGYQGYVHTVYTEGYPEKRSDVDFYICGWSNMIDDVVANPFREKAQYHI